MNYYVDLLLKLLTDLLRISLVQGDILQVKVNKLTSTKTQLPYSYYSLPYSAPKKIQDSTENLGEVLRGDRIENSLYVVSLTC
jgi:transmembrane 9 superfamily protein 2/4